MNATYEKNAQACIESMKPLDQTNLWHGIESMEPLDQSNLWHGIVQGFSLFDNTPNAGRLPAVMVLTDGLLNHMYVVYQDSWTR